MRTPEGTEPDFRLNIRGTAVDDGRRIRLNVAVNPKNLVNELLSHSHFVPDGEYLLLDVTEQIQREKMDIPITGRMLVLVRARVVAEEEMLFDPTDLQQKAVPVNE